MDNITPWKCRCGIVLPLNLKSNHIHCCEYLKRNIPWDGKSNGAFNAAQNKTDLTLLFEKIKKVTEISDDRIMQAIENSKELILNKISNKN